MQESDIDEERATVRAPEAQVQPGETLEQSEGHPTSPEGIPTSPEDVSMSPEELSALEQRRGERELREIDARLALRPLGPDEHPLALRIATAVATLLAAGVCLSVATVHDLARHGGSLPGGLFLAAVLLALAWGMYRRRYWAVLGFEALLAFQIIVTSLALIVAETLLAAGLCALSVGLAGWLFWKLVRVMGRIQAGGHERDEPLR